MSKFYLKDITSKIGSGATPTGGKEAYNGGDYALIRSQNVLDMSFSKEGLAYINDEQAKKLNGVTVEAGDVLFNITGDSICRCCMVPEDILPARVNQHVAIIRPVTVNSHFVMYYLQYMKPYLMNICGNGSSRNALTKENLEKLTIDVPKSADSIANILSSIDKKIENNKAISAELESMAKTIYDYWFLQFEFPNKDGNPYKSSKGEMEWNEIIGREIPKGWRVGKVKDCIEHINTGLNPRDNFTLGDGDIRYITVKNLTTRGTIDFSSCDTINEKARDIVHKRSDVREGDILFASIAPLGRCAIVMEPPEKWDINESVFAIRPNLSIVSCEYLYMYFMSEQFIKQAEHSSTGSVFNGIRISVLEDMPILLPDKGVKECFQDLSSKIFRLKYLCERENQELVSLRDFLLPLLMNGQVGFKEK